MVIEEECPRSAIRELGGATVLAAAAGAMVRLVSTLGVQVRSSYDSPSYFHFRLLGGDRFPAMTGFYSLVQSPRAIATIQSLVGAVAWCVASLMLAQLIRGTWQRAGFVALMGVIGATSPIASWDNALLSESLSISLGVVVLAFLVREYVSTPTRWTRAAAPVLLIWVLLRPSNASATAIAAAVLAVLWGVARIRRRASPLSPRVVAVTGVLAALGVLLSASQHDLQNRNAVQVIQRRVLGQPAEQWFVSNGMPANGLVVIASDAVASRQTDPTIALREDPTFGAWASRNAASTYTKFVLGNPRWVFDQTVREWRVVSVALTAGSSPARSRQVIPEPVERLVWPNSLPAAIFGGGVVFVLAIAGVFRHWRKLMRRRVIELAIVVGVATALDVIFVLHTAGDEYARLLIVSSCMLRVLVAWVLFDALSADPLEQRPIRSA